MLCVLDKPRVEYTLARGPNWEHNWLKAGPACNWVFWFSQQVDLNMKQMGSDVGRVCSFNMYTFQYKHNITV